MLNETLTTSNIPQSILNANATSELVKKLQDFESNALRTQVCFEKEGYAKATMVKNLLPITTIPIQEESKCANNEPSLMSLLRRILNFLKKILAKLFFFL